MGFYNKHVSTVMSQIEEELLNNMKKKGINKENSQMLFFIEDVKESISNENIEDMPKIIDDKATEFCNINKFDYSTIDTATKMICKAFNFFYDVDDAGEIIAGSIKYN